MKHLTAESVAYGHPDKVADIVSDSIVDAALAKDPDSRVAIETAVAENYVLIFGEITAPTLDYEAAVKNAMIRCGYCDYEGFNVDDVKIEVRIREQAAPLASASKLGAGDQGVVYGYACRGPNFMPAPLMLAHGILDEADRAHFGHDGKSQVTMLGDVLQTVVISKPYDKDKLGRDEASYRLKDACLRACSILGVTINKNTSFRINAPDGRWYLGGPAVDAGLTGRKTAVDTYGGLAQHGGGAFSGKDPSKMDRTGALAARWLAKNIVASGVAPECTVGFAFCLGSPYPLSLTVNLHGHRDEKVEYAVAQAAMAVIEWTPKIMIERLQLAQPQYTMATMLRPFTSTEFTWEQLDLIKNFAEFSA